MKVKTTYEAFDGEIFLSELDCLRHEWDQLFLALESAQSAADKLSSHIGNGDIKSSTAVEAITKLQNNINAIVALARPEEELPF